MGKAFTENRRKWEGDGAPWNCGRGMEPPPPNRGRGMEPPGIVEDVAAPPWNSMRMQGPKGKEPRMGNCEHRSLESGVWGLGPTHHVILENYSLVLGLAFFFAK